jgi:pimeloyl-ACP methyl ester carboxylesterase
MGTRKPAARLPFYGRSLTGAAAAALLAALLAQGCAGPAERMDWLAAGLGLARTVVEGEGFEHVAYGRALGGGRTAGDRLHVYLEGDGSPWLGRTRVALDPTPRDPLMLRLMALDPAPSVYLGRPCYHGLAASPGCHPWWWTHGRYGEPVVASMAAAVERLRRQGGFPEVALLGHSGGGTLAVLVAERLASVRAVLTVAPNLDPTAWARRHGYSPLAGSLDPAARAPLPSRVRVLHLFGELDRVIPPAFVSGYLAARPGTPFAVLPGVDHAHGWQAVWPAALTWLDGGPCPFQGCGTSRIPRGGKTFADEATGRWSLFGPIQRAGRG